MSSLDEVHFDVSLPQDRPFQVVGLGMNAVDWICHLPVYPEHNSKTAITEMVKLGGGPAATATALCGRYGLRSKYVGRVGDDEIGTYSLKDLEREPMDTEAVEVIPGASTQFAVILVDEPTGERTVLWKRDPRLNYRSDELRKEWVTCGQVLHLDGNEYKSRVQAARWAREAGMKICLDLDRVEAGVEELLAIADFVLPSENFVRSFSGRSDWEYGLLAVSRATEGFVAVTRGVYGVAAFWEGEIVRVPSFPVKVVESTGAGDVFHGAFVYSLFQDWSIEHCLRFSNAAGALACTRVGARGGIPVLEEVLGLLKP